MVEKVKNGICSKYLHVSMQVDKKILSIARNEIMKIGELLKLILGILFGINNININININIDVNVDMLTALVLLFF